LTNCRDTTAIIARRRLEHAEKISRYDSLLGCPGLLSDIEEAEDPHKSTAAICGNDRHDVNMATKKLSACSEQAIGFLDARRRLSHEIANGRLKRQTSAQRADELAAAAVTLQDSTFYDWERRVPALKLLQSVGQG
jgi:hypothetical protein